jgi:hypothetical protein
MGAAMIAPFAPPPVAHAVARGETRGALRAPTRLPGSLGIPIQGCQLSAGGTPTVLIRYRPRRLRIDGRPRAAQQIVTAVRFGTSDRHALGSALQFSLHAGGRTYRWTSVSGRLRWGDGLRAGSFTARLRPAGGAARATVRLRGSWRHCYTGPTL